MPQKPKRSSPKLDVLIGLDLKGKLMDRAELAGLQLSQYVIKALSTFLEVVENE